MCLLDVNKTLCESTHKPGIRFVEIDAVSGEGVVDTTQVQIERASEVCFIAVIGNASLKVAVHRDGIDEVLERIQLALHIAGQIGGGIIFRLIAEGRSVADISANLSLSQKTVANYQTLIKEKLGAHTTTALVHVALRHGVISPPG